MIQAVPVNLKTKRAFPAPPNRAEQKGAMETNELRS
jgi:hypothetical protein